MAAARDVEFPVADWIDFGFADGIHFRLADSQPRERGYLSSSRTASALSEEAPVRSNLVCGGK
jgi:hypothetical protein